MKKKGLGHFLLNGFKKAGKRKKPRGFLRKRGVTPTLRLSLMQGYKEAKTRQSDTPTQYSAQNPAQYSAQNPAQYSAEKLETSSPEVPPEILKEIPTEIAVIAPVLPAETPVQAAPQLPFLVGEAIHQQTLSTQDVTRPDDRMKQSIEAFLMDQRSPHTRRAYGKDLKRFVKFLLARNYSQGVENLTRTVLITYKESLLADGLEHTTVDRHLATLRSFFKWLVDDGLLTRSPAEGVRFLNPKRISRTNGFTDEEVRRVLSVPDLHTRTGAMHYAILMVLFYCGVRRSELCGLRTTDLGMERNQRILRLKGKGDAERIIVMLPAVWNSIRHYFYIARRALDADDFLFAPVRNNRTGNLKKPLNTSMIFYVVTRYAKLAKVSNRVSPHSCRATAISNARDHHVPDRAIQEFAGWASPDMITRYDKRKTSVINSAAHGIAYGAPDRPLPDVGGFPYPQEATRDQPAAEPLSPHDIKNTMPLVKQE